MSRKKESLSDLKPRPALETPIVMSTPKRTNNALSHLRERLEKQVQNSQGKPEKQISPTLEKLKMTPGRVLKDREVLASKHLSVRKKADKLNVGGGVCLWPGMEDMRLSQWEMVELLLVSVTLLVTVVYGFNKLHGNPPMPVETNLHYSWDYAQVHFPHHAQQVGPIYFKTPRKCNIFGVCSEGSGSTLEELFRYHSILKDFNRHHPIKLSSLNHDLLDWHRDYRKLIEHIHASFDMSRVPVMYVMYILVYSGGMGFLIYCLVDNMVAKSKLSPNRIKQWVSILIVISSWTGSLFYFLLAAYIVESSIEKNVTRLTHILGEALDKDLNTLKLSHMISYWKTIPEVGTLSVLGLLTVRDLMHYIQYYFIPIMTILATPIVRLIMSLYSIYHVS